MRILKHPLHVQFVEVLAKIFEVKDNGYHFNKPKWLKSSSGPCGPSLGPSRPSPGPTRPPSDLSIFAGSNRTSIGSDWTSIGSDQTSTMSTRPPLGWCDHCLVDNTSARSMTPLLTWPPLDVTGSPKGQTKTLTGSIWKFGASWFSIAEVILVHEDLGI